MLIKFKTYILTLKYINYEDLEILTKLLIYCNLLVILFLW